jgi:hypothetical protein
MEDIGIVCGHSVKFLAIWYILRPFGKACGHLVYFLRFGMSDQEKSGNPARLVLRIPEVRISQYRVRTRVGSFIPRCLLSLALTNPAKVSIQKCKKYGYKFKYVICTMKCCCLLPRYVMWHHYYFDFVEKIFYKTKIRFAILAGTIFGILWYQFQ